MKFSSSGPSEILVASHLQEIDDLKNHGRDGHLIDTPENREVLKRQAKAIIFKIKEGDKKSVLFVTSSKIRAIQTSEMIAEEIKRQLGENFHIRYSVDKNLISPDQGEFKLPEDYEAGDFFKGLDIAASIFLNESLGKNNTDQNLFYKFGDPVLLENGSYKYPDLLNYFTKQGETYGDSLRRIFGSVLEFSKKSHKAELSTEIVIVGHGFGFHIMRGLSVLSNLEIDELSKMTPNEVVKKIYEIYKKFDGVLGEMGCLPIDISNFKNPALIDLLNKLVNKL